MVWLLLRSTIIMGSRLSDCTLKGLQHTPHVLHDLHWLPVDMRIMYTVFLYTYKVLDECALQHICEIIEMHKPRTSLRASSQCMLIKKMHSLYVLGVGALSMLHIKCTFY